MSKDERNLVCPLCGSCHLYLLSITTGNNNNNNTFIVIRYKMGIPRTDLTVVPRL